MMLFHIKDTSNRIYAYTMLSPHLIISMHSLFLFTFSDFHWNKENRGLLHLNLQNHKFKMYNLFVYFMKLIKANYVFAPKPKVGNNR